MMTGTDLLNAIKKASSVYVGVTATKHDTYYFRVSKTEAASMIREIIAGAEPGPFYARTEDDGGEVYIN